MIVEYSFHLFPSQSSFSPLSILNLVPKPLFFSLSFILPLFSSLFTYVDSLADVLRDGVPPRSHLVFVHMLIWLLQVWLSLLSLHMLKIILISPFKKAAFLLLLSPFFVAPFKFGILLLCIYVHLIFMPFSPTRYVHFCA